MPLGSTGQEFWLERNVGVWYENLLTTYIKVQKTNWKHSKEKNWRKFCTRIPQGLDGQEFWPDLNVGIFAQKLVDKSYRSRKKIEISKKKKKERG